MIKDPDAYAIWGDWDLDRFNVLVARWRDTTHPPCHVYAAVDHWWRGLKRSAEWSRAVRVGHDLGPEGNLMWTWAPAVGWMDERHAHFRVHCRFRVFADQKPPRQRCEESITQHESLPPAEIDQVNGMG